MNMNVFTWEEHEERSDLHDDPTDWQHTHTHMRAHWKKKDSLEVRGSVLIKFHFDVFWLFLQIKRFFGQLKLRIKCQRISTDNTCWLVFCKN